MEVANKPIEWTNSENGLDSERNTPPPDGPIVIERATIPKELDEFHQLQIYITEINSPGKFWFRILGETTHPLNELMESIGNTYNRLTKTERRILPENLIPGQICAAMYEGVWHRGRIVQYLQVERMAMVHFVDYGTTSAVPADELKYLQRIYAEQLPVQAYRGCLDFIRPVDNQQWSRDATYAFKGMTANVVLTATLTAVLREEGIMRMMLEYVTPYTVDRINSALLNRGFAKAIWTPNLELSAGESYRHISECSPSFSDLENARYPSFDEVGRKLGQIYGLDSSAKDEI